MAVEKIKGKASENDQRNMQALSTEVLLNVRQ